MIGMSLRRSLTDFKAEVKVASFRIKRLDFTETSVIT